jgi:stress-induced morphogen
MATQARIISTLRRALQPVYLDVINESYMHSVPKDAETHFRFVC